MTKRGREGEKDTRERRASEREREREEKGKETRVMREGRERTRKNGLAKHKLGITSRPAPDPISTH